MALDLERVRRAVAETIKAGVDRAVNVYAYMPDAPAFPCAVVAPGDPYVTYHETFGDRALAQLSFSIHIGATSRAEDSLILIDDMLSSGAGKLSSVIDALEADPTLGAAVHSCTVMSATILHPGQPNAQVFAATLAVTIYESRG